MYSTYIQRIEIALLSDPWCIQLTLNTDSRRTNTDKYSLNILWREEQTTDTVGVASGLGEAFIEQKIIKIVSKGDEVSKINRGSGVLVVLRGL